MLYRFVKRKTETSRHKLIIFWYLTVKSILLYLTGTILSIIKLSSDNNPH